MILRIHFFFISNVFQNIIFNEKNKLKNTNNHISKILNKLKHIDYCRHLRWPFWIFPNARTVRRTPGPESAPPSYQKWPGCRLFRKYASRTLFKHILRFPNQSIYPAHKDPSARILYKSPVTLKFDLTLKVKMLLSLSI